MGGVLPNKVDLKGFRCRGLRTRAGRRERSGLHRGPKWHSRTYPTPPLKKLSIAGWDVFGEPIECVNEGPQNSDERVGRSMGPSKGGMGWPRANRTSWPPPTGPCHLIQPVGADRLVMVEVSPPPPEKPGFKFHPEA